MKQYCRYCAEASIYGDDTFACCKDNKLYDISKSKRANKCKNFVFCPNDLWRCDENGNFAQYKPRAENTTKQLNFFEKQFNFIEARNE